MTNAQIRQRAWQLYRERAGALLLASVVCFALMAISTIATGNIAAGAARSWIVFFIGVLVMPVTSLGMSGLMLRAWRGQAYSPSDLFAFVRDGQLLRKALWLLIAYSLLSQMPSLLVSSLGLDVQSGVETAAPMIAMLLQYWLTVTLMLAPYLFALDPSQPVFEPIHGSTRRMLGRFWQFFAFQWGVMWWLILIMVAVILALTFAVRSAALSVAAMQLLMLPAWPYLMLAQAGYADRRIREMDCVR